MALGSPLTQFHLQPPVRAQAQQNILDSLLQGIQQGVALRQLPQQLQNQAIAQQLDAALQQAKLEELTNPVTQNLRALQQQAALQSLQAQLNPNYQAEQNALKIAQEAALAGARERALLGARREFETPAAPKTTVLSPGQIVIDATGAKIAENPATEKQSKNTIVPAGAKVLDDQGKLIFENPATIRSSDRLKGYDTKTGLYGIFEPDERGLYPEGVVPESQVPKSKQSKPLSTTQVDNLAAYDLLEKKIDDIEKIPGKVRASNVGWLDSIVGTIQGVTGLGKKDTIALNDTFRSAVDSLVGEFSFGRGGKALTIYEQNTLAKYLPGLTQGDATFESRLQSFKNLVKELRDSRLQTLDDSGYDISKFRKRLEGGEENVPRGETAPASTTSGNTFKIVQ